jgi:flagellar basal-body rod protein FlgG
MNGAFAIGAIGLDAQQRALEVVANNIANINTVGFKRSSVQFSELMAPVTSEGDAVFSRDKNPAFAGVAVSATPRVWTAGDLKLTGQAMDLAVDGTGFIELLGPSGRTLLWRGGTLKVNSDGYLATSDGSVLRGMVAVPAGASNLTIDASGLVSATVDGETSARQLGQLELVVAKDPDSLVSLGDGRFEALDTGEISAAQPGEDGAGRFAQGALEASNVRLSDEMVSLLLLQRAFAANAQVVQAGDQLMSIVNTLRR